MAEVSVPVVRAMLDEATGKGYRTGVLGIRTQPTWSGPASFGHEGRPVTVVPCVSTLAVREALRDRPREGWLVVLTDRPADDLGASVLAHLLWHRLRTPDPWEAVRHRFAATGIDPALAAGAGHRDLATGLLAATPSRGTAPAPAGVLTRDHALATVAANHLGLADREPDAETVLAWAAGPSASTSVADLRALAGDAVTDAVLEWLAGAAGPARAPLLALLRAGGVADAVPVGLVVGVLAAARAATSRRGTTSPVDRLAEDQQTAREALVRLEARLGGAIPADAVLRSWSAESDRVVAVLLGQDETRPHAERLLARADGLLTDIRAEQLAGTSDVLPSALTRRLETLAAALRSAVSGRPAGATASVELAWDSVRQHRLAAGDRRIAAFRAAVRLLRWLVIAPVDDPVTDLAAATQRHADIDAWVDSAVNDAAPGVGDADLGSGLAAVLDAVRIRRDAHDVGFARALADHTRLDPPPGAAPTGPWHLEDVLADVVLPLATVTPTLLLVLDGMSAGVGTEVVGDILARPADGWVEALLPGCSRRAAALAVLPSLTEVSRASLLSGELIRGGQGVELRGFAALTTAHGLAGAALFHKKPLDSTRPGYAVSDDVGTAIDDTAGRPLVACVLNTIDDALDRSDPGGTDWGADVVRHLLPLLDRARLAGRVVVLTSDHGHVVERRTGEQRFHSTISSGRSRSNDSPAGDGEILVEGRRVLDPDHRAVLAVDERLRYAPLKAGYHGGAGPAEVVVPVVALVCGAVPDGVDLRLAPPQEPTWWNAPVPAGAPPSVPIDADPTSPSRGRALPAGPQPGLFDVDAPPPAPKPAPIAVSGSLFASIAEEVVRSRVYTAQRSVAGRISVSDSQVQALLTALLGAPSQRLSPTQAATALSMSTVLLRGAVLHVQRLLNVESYPVLRIDADGSTIVLDEQMLREQFEVGS